MPDWLIKALKTFVEAAVSFVVADAAVIGDALTDWETKKHIVLTIGIGALAAGISAAWNIIVEKLNEKD